MMRGIGVLLGLSLIGTGVLWDPFVPEPTWRGKTVLSGTLRAGPLRLSPEVTSVLITDTYVYCPTPAEIRSISRRIKPRLNYRPEVYDCDDFAIQFKAEANRIWAEEHPNWGAPLAVAVVGALILMPDGGLVPHAFNVIWSDSGTPILIEPQGPGLPKGWTVLQTYFILL